MVWVSWKNHPNLNDLSQLKANLDGLSQNHPNLKDLSQLTKFAVESVERIIQILMIWNYHSNLEVNWKNHLIIDDWSELKESFKFG